MNFEEVALKVVNVLNDIDFPYFVTGALAVGYYGEPRTTHDIDLVIEIKEQDVDHFINSFEDDFWLDDIAIVTAIREGGRFTMVHKETGFKADFWLLEADDFSKTRFSRRVLIKIFDTKIFFPTPEDVIISKLEWYKISDIDVHYFDALGVYRIQKEKLDAKYIDDWSRKKLIQELWVKIKKEG